MVAPREELAGEMLVVGLRRSLLVNSGLLEFPTEELLVWLLLHPKTTYAG